SQAYTMAGTDRFKCMPSMKILVKDINDPMEIKRNGRYGAIHIIDLANEDTCAFIATQDLGLLHDDDSFEVIGRIDSADLRGCNLLYIAP
ncbi:MAG TPA: acyl transferase, partial [Saprospiraceae bacterium]|nr:acyl transferase [Saprospiraceae bacterium]